MSADRQAHNEEIIPHYNSSQEVVLILFGEMAEWSNAAVLKTVEGHTSGGSNPSFSASNHPQGGFFISV